MNTPGYQDIIRYHEVTKHHYHRYAKSPGYMDWQNQPNPYRFYTGKNIIYLPLLDKDPATAYPDLYCRQNNPPRQFILENIAGFLELSLGLSAWKSVAGSKWSLRINPSSGNLHPTEAHLVLPAINSMKAGVYHYNPFIHALESRIRIPGQLWANIVDHFETEGFLIGLSSIFWRESWKYGERAFRYCNHDVGHALAALCVSANLWGWKLSYLNALSDDDVSTVLGFDRTGWKHLEGEEPDLLCFVHGYQNQDVRQGLPEEIIAAFSELEVAGEPNVLSKENTEWAIIYQTAALTRKPATAEMTFDAGTQPFVETPGSELSASAIIRQRRSATDFNPNGSIPQGHFLAMLDKTIARDDCAPFDIRFIKPSVNLLLFVHRVDSLDRGLYFFMRNQADLDELRHISDPDFLWQPIQADIPLYLLKAGDFRHEAMAVSCHQEIAGSSAFSVGMITKFREIIKREPYRYRHLFWETGMIGQVLYLEAEAHGVRGTGIGCFFDDAVHDILGFRDNTWQSLYHFTVGDPVEDPRLTTHAAYHHLQRHG
ncbi:MAG: SagB/ThcOx family dehydrogenase [Desulfobacterales bacterium]|jgi:SagB-type dehydrogenase family enzyme